MPPTPSFLTGFEHGVAIAGAAPSPDARIWAAVTTTGGTPTIESTGAIKHGVRVLRVPGSATGLSHVNRPAPATQNIAVGSVYILFEGSLPSADCRFGALTTSGSFCFLKFLVASNTIVVSTGATDSPGFVVQADVWYLVDFVFNVSANPWRLDWAVNGARQQGMTSAIAANTFVSIRLGGNVDTTTATVVVRWDDVVFSFGQTGDFPMGEHEVLALHPNRDGTHSFTAGDFIHGDAGSSVGVSDTDVYTYLDDPTIETIDTTDSIRQSVVNASGYVEIGIESPPVGPQPRTAWAIQVSGAYDSTSAALNACTLKENEGGTLRNVYADADVSNTSVTFLSHCLTTSPVGNPYTRAVLESLMFRWGFSGTVPPILHSLIVEAAFPIVDLPDGFGGGGFAAWSEVAWGAIPDAVGGTLFTVDLAGAIAPSGVIVQQINKILAGVESAVGTLAKQIQRSLTAAESPAGALTNQPQTLVGGSISPTGALTNLKLVILGLAGAISPTGALLEQVQRTFVAALSPTGVLTKQLQRLLAGTESPSGNLIQQVQKLLSGALSPSGALALSKVALLALAGAINPSGAIIKQIQRILTAAESPSGALVQQTQKLLSGTESPSGVVTEKTIRTFTAAISPTGALATIKLVITAVGGTIAPTGTLLKSVARVLVASIAPTGAMIRQTNKIISGVLAPVGVVIKQVQRTFTAVLLVAGTVVSQLVGFIIAKFFTLSTSDPRRTESTPGTPRTETETQGRRDESTESRQRIADVDDIHRDAGE